MEFERWPIFGLVKPEFLEKIKMASVFGKMGQSAIIVTKDDNVYGFGLNDIGSLGVGHKDDCMAPEKITVLCQKKIKGISIGSGSHVLAYTETGELYSWGNNCYGQLGNGSTENVLSPELVTNAIQDKVIVKIAAGAYHSLALTDSGEVYEWGTYDGNIPRLQVIDKKVVDISCGKESSCAVTDNGEVYAWRSGIKLQSFGYNGQTTVPAKVTSLRGVVFTKITCGRDHTLALSDEGKLWVWGDNSFGQLGIRNKQLNNCEPTMLTQIFGKIVNIAASHYNNISAAMTENSKVYMWGECKGRKILSPMETGLTSLHDVFALWAQPSVTYDTLVVNTSTKTSLSQAIALALDDEETSDIIFIVDGIKLQAHKSIMKIRCQYFRNMFRDYWKENQMEEVEIKDYSYVVFRAFIHFIYTDTVNVSPEDAIELLDLSNLYCEELLKNHCVKIIRQAITPNNVVMFYMAAIKYEAKELEEFCFQFALSHMNEIVYTEAFMALDKLTMITFIQGAAQHRVFKDYIPSTY